MASDCRGRSAGHVVERSPQLGTTGVGQIQRAFGVDGDSDETVRCQATRHLLNAGACCGKAGAERDNAECTGGRGIVDSASAEAERRGLGNSQRGDSESAVDIDTGSGGVWADSRRGNGPRQKEAAADEYTAKKRPFHVGVPLITSFAFSNQLPARFAGWRTACGAPAGWQMRSHPRARRRH